MGKQLELCERAGQSWAEKLWESMPKEIREEVVRLLAVMGKRQLKGA